ncbi:hypothetical protein W02_33640 [Nitrospira sp. KM1]|nr:hypothetical protein W02_33640 [Nitrospira sp. KM1]
MRRVPGGDEEDAVELEHFARLARNRKVPIVDRIEGAAEKTETHGRVVPSVQNLEAIPQP